MGSSKKKDSAPDAPKFKLGPVKQVRYDEDGNVLGWAQDHLDEDGNPTGGTVFHTTELGRKKQIEEAAKKAAKCIHFFGPIYEPTSKDVNEQVEDIANS